MKYISSARVEDKGDDAIDSSSSLINIDNRLKVCGKYQERGKYYYNYFVSMSKAIDLTEEKEGLLRKNRDGTRLVILRKKETY